jgi:glycerophosphoryl diester phosphodiesterase
MFQHRSHDLLLLPALEEVFSESRLDFVELEVRLTSLSIIVLLHPTLRCGDNFKPPDFCHSLFFFFQAKKDLQSKVTKEAITLDSE